MADRFDFQKRRVEKQLSRDADAKALESGEKSPEQLRLENGWFSGLNVKIDWSRSRQH